MKIGSGSDGYTSVARIKAMIDEFYNRPSINQTSAVFANLWSSRAVHHLDVSVDYIIGGGEDTSVSSGWWAYLRRLHGSTYNTSTKSVGGILGLPDDVWADFVVDRATLAAATSHTDGTTDADHGRRVYEFLVSAAIDSPKYHRGQYRELLEAWAARGSSDAGSSG